MSADETLDIGILVRIRADADSVLARLRGPVGHAERRGDQLHGAAIVHPATARTDVRVDSAHRALLYAGCPVGLRTSCADTDDDRKGPVQARTPEGPAELRS